MPYNFMLLYGKSKTAQAFKAVPINQNLNFDFPKFLYLYTKKALGAFGHKWMVGYLTFKVFIFTMFLRELVTKKQKSFYPQKEGNH